MRDAGVSVNWTNCFGLLLRASLNICFQLTIIKSMILASKLGINQGLITVFLSFQCLFAAGIFKLWFHERLNYCHYIGITLLVGCAIAMASAKESRGEVNNRGPTFHSLVLLYLIAILSPLLISIFLGVTRHWNRVYGYNLNDLNVDTYFVMGLVETYFFYHY